MALRGTRPKAEDKRMKALFFGEAGSGKTTCAIQFPRPYVIDTERGCVNDQYVDLIASNDGSVFASNQFDEIVEEVLNLLTEKHSYRTLVIDPITTVYDDLIEQSELKVGTDFGRHYGEAKKRWKRLGNLLMRLDMNVIVTSHQKKLYGDAMKVIGNTFDGPKGLDYMFDIVIEAQKAGTERVGIVRKSRVASMRDGDIFPFCYDGIADLYGRAILERDATPVVLVGDEAAAELRSMLDARKDGEELLNKWLIKARADSIAELSADTASKCIDYLRGKAVA